MADNPYLPWPVFKRSVVAAFARSLTATSEHEFLGNETRANFYAGKNPASPSKTPDESGSRAVNVE